jgi:hypothetical protein
LSWASGTLVVEGNYIGTNAAGTAALGNGGYGIDSHDGGGIVGGSVAGAGNVISGNHQGGIWVTVTGISIEGNLIGTNAAGTAALGNGGWGGILLQTSGNTVGGTTTYTRNIISGNASGGIDDPFGRNLIEGNYIGTNEAGTAALGNAGDGVQVDGQDTIGGTAAGAGNVISGNAVNGVEVASASVSGNLIAGNYIGINAAGTAAVPNTADGILVNGGADTIGGTTASARNVISGNGTNGIEFITTSGTVVEGNRIGTNAAGTAALGNARDGVLLSGYSTSCYTSNNNTIGGTASGAGNTIAFNGLSGVGVEPVSGSASYVNATSYVNAILSNSIYSNGLSTTTTPPAPIDRLGIDLGLDGVTLNNSEGHSGPNHFQNFPVIASVTPGAGATTITGSLNSTANTPFLVQFFASAAANPTGYGEGQTFLGQATVTTDGTGNVSFTATVNPLPGGQNVISATATDPGGNTSEFSGNVKAPQTTTTTLTASANPSVYGQMVTFTATVAAVSSGTAAPTGTVVFLDGSTQIGSGKVSTSNGVTTATFSTSTLSAATHPITAVYGGDANDQGSTSNVVNETITPAPLTVAGITANNKVYDSTTTATLNTAVAVLVGVYPGDSVTLNTAGATGTFASKDVGGGITVAVAGLTLSGPQASDYALIQPTTTASITPAPVTVTGITANSKVYDSTTTATLSTGSAALVGVYSGDAVSLVTAGYSASFADPNVGAAKPVTVTGLSLAGPQAFDYALTQPNGMTASIAPAALIASLIGTVDKTYDGTTGATLAAGNYQLSGVLGSDQVILSDPTSGTYDTKNVGTSKTVTVSGLALSGVAAGNYELASTTISGAVGEIDKANATISVTPYTGATVTYDGNAHTATGTATGVAGESLAGLDLSGTTHTGAGTYSDTWTFTDVTGNYNNASGSVTDSIAKANANIVVTPYSVTYDGNAHTATGTATGVGGVALSGLDLSGTTHTDAGTYTGTYPDTWTFTDTSGNYNNATGAVSDSIAKANATISVTPYSVTYDGNPHTATGTATGVKGEILADLDLSDTIHTNPGDYPTDPWTFTDVTGNYNNTGGTVHDSIATPATIVTISGVVFADGKQNTPLDGIQGPGEPGLGGVTLTLTGTTAAGGSLTDHATTNSSGTYLLTEPPGTYSVAVDASNFAGGGALVGEIPVTEVPGSTGATIVGHSLQITLAAGQSSTGNNFTEFQPYDGKTGAGSIGSNFNGTAIAAGNTLWFNSVLKVGGLSSVATTTLLFVNQSIDFTVPGSPSTSNPNGGKTFRLAVPNTRLTFSPTVTASTASVTFDTTHGEWDITVPTSTSGNTFLSGFAFPVPAGGLPGGINPVTWSGNMIATAANVSVNWQWAAAVYTSFSSDYTQLGVKPLDVATGQYPNLDHAGTPESYKSFVTGGARGGGGSNYTGSYSGTGAVTPTDPPIGAASPQDTGQPSAFRMMGLARRPAATVHRPTTVPAVPPFGLDTRGQASGAVQPPDGMAVDLVLSDTPVSDWIRSHSPRTLKGAPWDWIGS